MTIYIRTEKLEKTKKDSSMVAQHQVYYDHDFMSCFRVHALYKRKSCTKYHIASIHL